MTPDRALDAARWARVAELFDAAAELPDDEQERLLASRAGDDHALQETVRRMLAADRAEPGLLARGVGDAAHLALHPEAVLAPGTRVGAFDVLGELGRGGMGVVYAAIDRHLGRPAALKFLPPAAAAAGAAAAERILAEAKAASALDHPNVAAVYQVAETPDGRRFIAMARYDGETLRDRLARGPLSPAAALRVARQTAAGLAAAHRIGIVHRDVSAANIFLTRDGTVKLLDFGIAALGAAAATELAGAGTPSSMSPEQARGEPADARADVWALGAVLFRMLTGNPPFAGPTAEVLRSLRGPEPAPRLTGRRGVPRRIARVVDRALAKAPAARYADGGEMLAALDAAARPARSRAVLAAAPAVVLAAAGIALLRAPSAPAAAQPPVVRIAPVAGARTDTAAAAVAGAVLDEVAHRLTVLGRVRVVEEGAGGGPTPSHQLELALTRAPAASGAGAVRLAATLRAADRAGVVWSESREFDPSRLRELSRDLVDGVLRGLGLTLTAREHAALAVGFPSTVEAYRHFLAANQLLASRTPDSVLAAIDRYALAHRLDPEFVSALARHAYALSLLLDWGWRHPTLSRAELLAEGEALSARALRLDSTSSEAWLARAYLRVATDPLRMTGAAEAFRQAIALDPYSAEAYHQYGQTLMQLGRLDEATTAYRRAVELAPDAAMSLVSLGGIAELRGRRREALRLLDSAVAVAPGMAYARAIRALVRVYDGDYTGAREDAARAIALDSAFPVPGLAAMAMAAQALGDTAATQEWLARAEAAVADPSAPTPDETHMIANAQVALGRISDAVELLRRTRPRGATLWYLLRHRVFDPLRRDPAAAAILAEADPRS